MNGQELQRKMDLTVISKMTVFQMQRKRKSSIRANLMKLIQA